MIGVFQYVEYTICQVHYQIHQVMEQMHFHIFYKIDL